MSKISIDDLDKYQDSKYVQKIKHKEKHDEFTNSKSKKDRKRNRFVNVPEMDWDNSFDKENF